MKRITCLFLIITLFQSFMRSQELTNSLNLSDDFLQFLEHSELPEKEISLKEEKDYERLLTLSPFFLPESLEATRGQEKILEKKYISSGPHKEALTRVISPHYAQQPLKKKCPRAPATKYNPYYDDTNTPKRINDFLFECLEFTNTGVRCQQLLTERSLYSHLNKYHKDTLYNNSTPLGPMCCNTIKQFKWITLIAKHSLLAAHYNYYNPNCHLAKDIIASLIGRPLLLRTKASLDH